MLRSGKSTRGGSGFVKDFATLSALRTNRTLVLWDFTFLQTKILRTLVLASECERVHSVGTGRRGGRPAKGAAPRCACVRASRREPAEA
eukprot:6196309-Pleurochrysis_carterae.AAC.1